MGDLRGLSCGERNPGRFSRSREEALGATRSKAVERRKDEPGGCGSARLVYHRLGKSHEGGSV